MSTSKRQHASFEGYDGCDKIPREQRPRDLCHVCSRRQIIFVAMRMNLLVFRIYSVPGPAGCLAPQRQARDRSQGPFIELFSPHGFCTSDDL
jgi:hypothetical protein